VVGLLDDLPIEKNYIKKTIIYKQWLVITMVGYEFLSQNCLINLNPQNVVTSNLLKIATSQLEQPKINLLAILLLVKLINHSYSISM
jgi:hypothetical protein